MQIFQGITAIKVGIFLALLFGAVALLALGFQLGGYQNPDLAKVCYVLAALFFAGAFVALFWSWLRRVRIGLAPPDAELRQAKEAQKRLFETVKQQQRELGALRTGTKRLREKLRKAEQERERLAKELEEARSQQTVRRPSRSLIKRPRVAWMARLQRAKAV